MDTSLLGLPYRVEELERKVEELEEKLNKLIFANVSQEKALEEFDSIIGVT